jgi:hypothetical protein
MTAASDFVTVLKTTNPQLIDMVVAMFESEGIPFEHPGKNYAALNTGMGIEIELRVPASSVDHARALLDEMRRRDHQPSTPRIAFCVKETHPVLGAVVGELAAIAGVKALFSAANSPLAAAILLVGPCIGFALGRTIGHYVCSQPDCGHRVPFSATRCPNCGSDLHGCIASRREHFNALEQYEASQNTDRPS